MGIGAGGLQAGRDGSSRGAEGGAGAERRGGQRSRSARACRAWPTAISPTVSTRTCRPPTSSSSATSTSRWTSCRPAMRGINENSGGVKTAASEISHAADDLSRRTEQQAASLEETAAALDEITATVQQDGRWRRVRPTRSWPTRKSEAERSGEVVRNAVAAMGEIEAVLPQDRPDHRRRSTRSPSRPTCWPSTPASKLRALAKPAAVSRSSLRKFARWPSARRTPPKRSRR